jgi:hypothetical protein
MVQRITNIGVVLACLLPLLVCVYVLWCVGRKGDSDAEVSELLVQELVSERPMLLGPKGAALTHAAGETTGGQLVCHAAGSAENIQQAKTRADVYREGARLDRG